MSEDASTLEIIRSRSLLYGSYVIWTITAAVVLLAVSSYLSAVQSWLTTVERFRGYLGFARPIDSPDWILVAATALAALLPLILALFALVTYKRAWRRRLTTIWGHQGGGSAEKVRRLTSKANDAELQHRSTCINALAATERWQAHAINVAEPTAEAYHSAAERVLAEIEKDIAQRAITLGFVVGLSRNNWLDSFAIASAAFELQLHVLTTLGKRPSRSTWVRLWKRTLSSLFLSWYLNAEQSLTFRLMIRKLGLGLEAGSAALEHAANTFMHSGAQDDVDWDDVEHLLPESVLGIPVRPFTSGARMLAGTLVSVGTFGMNQIGRFIEQRGEDLFQGAVAASILYEHGVALAADCLALDAAHRATPRLSPRFVDVMTRMSSHAGLMLQEQVRGLRTALRERRRMLAKLAKGKAGGAAASVATATKSMMDAGLRRFRRSPTEPPPPEIP